MLLLKVHDRHNEVVGSDRVEPKHLPTFLAGFRKGLPTYLADGYTLRIAVAPHVCQRHAVEVGLSDCAYGCKIFRCRECSTRATLHSRTYGCRHSQAL